VSVQVLLAVTAAGAIAEPAGPIVETTASGRTPFWATDFNPGAKHAVLVVATTAVALGRRLTDRPAEKIVAEELS
jgi:hypothetical protein